MTYDFTPAAQRALRRATHTKAGGDIRCGLLLGLLAESESRAAGMLARHSVNADTLLSQWPDWGDFHEMAEVPDDDGEGRVKLPHALEQDLDQIAPTLSELPRPVAISTEHLLLAILDSSSPITAWLRAHGVTATELKAEIFRLHGVSPGPAQVNEPVSETPAVGATAVHSRNRILDASGNRASEALRVIEDFLRFGLEDAHLSALAKQLRHDLTEVLASLPLRHRLAARDTLNDVGTSITAEAEYRRDTDASIVEANFSRLQQSLRSLEEFSKIDHSNVAVAIEQLRYRAYTLHRAVGTTGDNNQRLADARLYVLLDGGRDASALKHLADALVDSGVDVLQLRDKSLDDRQLLERARVLRAATASSSTLFIMNDRPDLAMLSDADGVHVGQDELAVRDARKIIGLNKLVGVSTHNIEQARQAVVEGASYLGAGPIFPSRTKQFEEFAGLAFARQAAAEITLPAFAIGGIDTDNIHEVIKTGMSRVAIGAAVTGAANPANAAQRLLAILHRFPQ